jgi:hypothetical protein
MFRERENIEIQKYEIGNGVYVYSRTNFDAVIIDYGFSRCETDEHIITPMTRGLNSNFYEFNEYYDVASFLYYIVLQINIGNPIFDNLNINMIGAILAAYFRIDIGELENYYRTYHNITFWRPTPENLYRQLPLSLPELLRYIARTFIENNFITSYNDIQNYLNTLPPTEKFFVSNVNIEHQNIITYSVPPILPPNETELVHNLYTTIDNVLLPYEQMHPYYIINVDNIVDDGRRFRINYENFNRTRGTVPDLSTQFITTVKMLQPSHNPENPFRFRSDCCRIDVKSYFQNNILIVISVII